ncbi:MAG: class I SAM-dependent methyltransferase [Cyanobacteriota bacterium]
MKNYSYIGSELELFRKAQNWKDYWSCFIRKYLGDEVLEVGAGIGATTEVLCTGNQKRWVCLEPDSILTQQLKALIKSKGFTNCCEVRIGTLLDLNPNEMFDAIVYIDVLEHIKNDSSELEAASRYLKTGGYIIVLAPAHPWLFTKFDEGIGHYRRYNKSTLSAIIPDNLKCVKLIYLDCVGLMASLGNRLILNSKMPNINQITIWDKFMVPLSRKIDPLIQYSLGKSILGVWRKN